MVCVKKGEGNEKEPVEEKECNGEKPPTRASCDAGMPC